MNFAVDVTDAALDSLPQDLPFAAFGRSIDALELMLGNDPVAASRKIEHPADNSFTNGCRGGFQEKGRVYLFTALFYYSLDERIVYVWNIHLTEG
jgi:hypothetical protein